LCIPVNDIIYISPKNKNKKNKISAISVIIIILSQTKSAAKSALF
jgi:hypothetical protein